MGKSSALKVKTGKKRVTVSFKKAQGATKYEIYRSLKKGSRYKRIATVRSTRYTDRKVVKGKKYYYKVRTVRTGLGTIRSGFASPKRSKKVR